MRTGSARASAVGLQSGVRAEPVVVVVGAGVAGLTAAITLAQRGVPVRMIAEGGRSGRASWVAPALFTPYAGLGGPRFRRWAERSLAEFRALSRDSSTGVCFGEAREYRTTQQRSEPWLMDLLEKAPRPAPSPYIEATTSRRPHIDTTRYLPWLEARAAALGVSRTEARVHRLDDLLEAGARVVVHCSGPGARELADDPLVAPVHGQVLHTANDVGLTYSVQDDVRDGHFAYIFHFGDRLVLGGTFDVDRDDAGTDRAALDAIVVRCRELLRLDGFARWSEVGRTELAALGGVRPVRGPRGEFEHTRVEAEARRAGTVVHHYGHGRAGISLTWGSAEDAADLVETALASAGAG